MHVQRLCQSAAAAAAAALRSCDWLAWQRLVRIISPLKHSSCKFAMHAAIFLSTPFDSNCWGAVGKGQLATRPCMLYEAKDPSNQSISAAHTHMPPMSLHLPLQVLLSCHLQVARNQHLRPTMMRSVSEFLSARHLSLSSLTLGGGGRCWPYMVLCACALSSQPQAPWHCLTAMCSCTALSLTTASTPTTADAYTITLDSMHPHGHWQCTHVSIHQTLQTGVGSGCDSRTDTWFTGVGAPPQGSRTGPDSGDEFRHTPSPARTWRHLST